MARRLPAILVGVAVIAAVVWLILKAMETDEQKIVAEIAGFERAIESRSPLGFMDGVDSEYKDCKGLRYDELKAVVFRTFREFESLELELTDPKVIVADDAQTATAHFTCRLTAALSAQGATTDLVGDHLKAPLIVLKFVNRDGRWKVTRAEYGPGAKAPSGSGAGD